MTGPETDTCPDCSGSGFRTEQIGGHQATWHCRMCRGTGFVTFGQQIARGAEGSS